MMEKIYLWPEGEAPYYNPSLGQEEPYLLCRFSNDPNPRGALIICPGGAYRMKAPHDGQPVAELFAQAGFNTFVLEYRVAPYRYPAPLLDAQRAIRMIRANAVPWHISPQHIAILGFSAGGALAGEAATHYDFGNPNSPDPIERVSCRPDAFLPCFGVLSFGKYTHKPSAENLLGKPYGELTQQEIQDHSAELLVNHNTPPCFLWHTAEDASVPVENSLLMAESLSAHHIPFSLHVFPFGSHGSGVGAKRFTPLVTDWETLARDWLLAYGF